MSANNKNLSKKEFDELCSCGDLLSALGLGCYEQRGPIRHYMLVNRQTGSPLDFTINTTRNQWISRRDKTQGGAADIIDYLGLNTPSKGHSREALLLNLMFHYRDQQKLPTDYPTVDIHISRDSVVDITEIKSHNLFSLLSQHGISAKTANDCHVREARVLYPGSKEVVSRLCFPADNGNCVIFDGKTFRPLHDKSITTIGTHQQFQICNIFENWMDYLAFQERRHRTGQYLLARDYTIILNGKGNVGQTMDFLHQSPDFQEVRSFMPFTADKLFLNEEIYKATKGTMKDCSGCYKQSGSMLADILPQPPMWYRNVMRIVEKKVAAMTEKRQETLKGKTEASRNRKRTGEDESTRRGVRL